MSDVLTKICDDKRVHVNSRKAAVPLADLEAHAAEQDPPRGFVAGLKKKCEIGEYALIAEIKKASPSKGLIRNDFDPPSLATAYAAGGATCLSVLTDEPYFQGKDEYLTAARSAVSLPALRKDFMIDPYQVVEARSLGADCILVIMAALSDAQAAEISAAAAEWTMDVLVETHSEAEVERALALNPKLIGVNNRNLKTLEVHLATTERLAPVIQSAELETTPTIVCESGLYTGADLDRMADIGVTCFLIGESLMRQTDVAAATRELLQNPRVAASARAAGH